MPCLTRNVLREKGSGGGATFPTEILSKASACLPSQILRFVLERLCSFPAFPNRIGEPLWQDFTPGKGWRGRLIYSMADPADSADKIYASHIASTSDWWTRTGLVNTTSAIKEIGIQFDNGQTRTITLGAMAHSSFLVSILFGNQAQPDIHYDRAFFLQDISRASYFTYVSALCRMKRRAPQRCGGRGSCTLLGMGLIERR